MPNDLDARLRDTAKAALRIAAGLAYFSHGAQKLFGWFGGFGPSGGSVELMTRFGAAGVVEVVTGAHRARSLHATGCVPRVGRDGGDVLLDALGSERHNVWWENRGELPLLYAFIFFLYFAWGAGPVSLDGRLRRRR